MAQLKDGIDPNDDTGTSSGPVDVTEIEEPIRKLTRGELRGLIFDNTKAERFKSTKVIFFGQPLVIRQLSTGEILNLAKESDTDRKSALVRMMIAHCYVGDTSERVFESTDADVLMQLPWGDDFIRVQDAIAAFTRGDVKEEIKN
jgi:hypothetical protein